MPDRVVVKPYDPEWPHRFDQEATVLETVFKECAASIEHIGSTAVPGLGAKPVIDVMIGLGHLSDAEKRIAALEAAGYEYVQKYEAQLPQRRYFRKPRPERRHEPRLIHLHCVIKGSDFWVRHLAFRDYLRAHPESAAAYFALKQALVAQVSKAEYTDAKSPFIERILSAALGLDGQPSQQDDATDRTEPRAG